MSQISNIELYSKIIGELFENAENLITLIKKNTDHKKKIITTEGALYEHIFSKIVMKIYLHLMIILESNGFAYLTQALMNEFNKYKSNLFGIENLDFIDSSISPIIEDSKLFFEVINVNATKIQSNESEWILLRQILRGTAKIISDRKLEPNNECVIKNEIYNFLIHIFPDTVREIPISKISKIYKPDIGIKKLKCAIEYKFADSLKEVKRCIGGIFEDIKGYEGSEDWKNFIAVIYMTDNFLTENQIKEDFILSKVPHNWELIVVYGKGMRTKKTNRLTT